MNEFEQKDYEQSRNYADAIKTNADNIMGIFERIDSIMKSLYGETWQSSGAETSYERYNELRSNYEIFYKKVVDVHDHIYKVTASNESTDSTVSQSVAGV